MPIVQSQLVARGIDFPNAFVVNPECCPSRSTILTGEYSHKTGVYSNKPPDGGFQAFEPDEGSTMATWLHAAGYHTGLVGKYLNGYDDTDAGHVPPGWDDWVALTHGTAENGPGGYYKYTLSVGSSAAGGKPQRHGKGPQNYSTDVLGRAAVRFVDEAPADQPLFLYFAPYAPHGPIRVARQFRNACASLTWTNPPTFDAGSSPRGPEPAFQAKQAPLSRKDKRKIDRRHFQACRSLLSVDQWVGRILGALQATGRLDDSMVVFMSDNGYLLGEHRRIGKVVPYDESIRVPMVVRYDPVTAAHAGTKNPDMVLNLDIAPTFADAAGVSTPSSVDGLSMLPILSDPGANWRSHFLIEHGPGGVPAYCAIRTTDWKYVLYATGEEELYHLTGSASAGDGPYELVNQAANPEPLYRNELTKLRAVEQQMCRPQPPGGLPTP